MPNSAVQDDATRFNAYLLADDFSKKIRFPPHLQFHGSLPPIESEISFEEAVKEMRSASKLSSPIAIEALRRLLQLDTGTDAEREWARKLWQQKDLPLRRGSLPQCLLRR